MGVGGCDEEVASSKKKNELKTRVRKSIPYLWPKRLKNHTLWGRTYMYSLNKGVPPPGLVYFKNVTWFTQKSELFLYHCWSTITVSKIEESKDVATTRNWGPESAEKVVFYLSYCYKMTSSRRRATDVYRFATSYFSSSTRSASIFVFLQPHTPGWYFAKLAITMNSRQKVGSMTRLARGRRFVFLTPWAVVMAKKKPRMRLCPSSLHSIHKHSQLSNHLDLMLDQ